MVSRRRRTLPGRGRRSPRRVDTVSAVSAGDAVPAVECCLDLIGAPLHLVVLPNADDRPTLAAQDRVVPGVPLPVGEELCPPQRGVGLRELRVLLAPVPETAVDEDRDPGSGEDEVGACSSAGADPAVDEEPPAAGVERTAQGEFRCGVTAAEPGHVTAALRVGFPSVHATTVRNGRSTSWPVDAICGEPGVVSPWGARWRRRRRADRSSVTLPRCGGATTRSRDADRR
jgi:hypothetical protein